MRKNSTNTSCILLSSCFAIFCFIACRKTDASLPKTKATPVERFFTIPSGTDPLAIAISENMRRQEKQKPFVKEFVTWAGYPLWNKAVKMNNNSLNSAARVPPVGATNEVLIIPFARDSETRTAALVLAVVSARDTVLRTVYHHQYKNFPYDNGLSSDSTSEKAALLFMAFDNLTFGHTQFYIKDSLLFGVATPGVRHRVVGNDSVTMARLSVDICITVSTPNPDDTPPPTNGPGTPTPAVYQPSGGMAKLSTLCYTIDVGGVFGGGGYGGGGGDWNDNPCKPAPGYGGYGSCGSSEPEWMPVVVEELIEIMPDNSVNYNIDENNNTIGGYDNTPYPQFDINSQDWPTIVPIIPEVNFVPLVHSDDNCMELAKQQIAKKGYQISDYLVAGQTIQIYKTATGADINEAKKAVSYLIYALQHGIPVIVGVDNQAGSPNQATDQTTDHFVVIVGMGTDANGKYFRFYDNATSLRTKGTSSNNKLYYNATTGLITGKSQTSYATTQNRHDYIVTMIRKSKPL